MYNCSCNSVLDDTLGARRRCIRHSSAHLRKCRLLPARRMAAAKGCEMKAGRTASSSTKASLHRCLALPATHDYCQILSDGHMAASRMRSGGAARCKLHHLHVVLPAMRPHKHQLQSRHSCTEGLVSLCMGKIDLAQCAYCASCTSTHTWRPAQAGSDGGCSSCTDEEVPRRMVQASLKHPGTDLAQQRLSCSLQRPRQHLSHTSSVS